MNVLPAPLASHLEETLGVRPETAAALGGGMVNQACRVDTADGRLFVKWNAKPLPDLFEKEADGLRRLALAGALRVPAVVATEPASNEAPAYLALEWIAERAPRDAAAFAAAFAHGLARLHRDDTSVFDGFGLDTWNYLGAVRQDNTQTDEWAVFYRDCRVAPQLALSRQQGRMPGHRERLVRTVMDGMEDLLADMPARPSLIHGDLWSGNFLSAGQEPVVIDPAVYYADREIEMAYVELFGGFPAGFRALYEEEYPLDPGYDWRRPLHQLYPLLIHLNHFGETYGPAVEEACRPYV